MSKLIEPSLGDVVQINTTDWYRWCKDNDGKFYWQKMTEEEYLNFEVGHGFKWYVQKVEV